MKHGQKVATTVSQEFATEAASMSTDEFAILRRGRGSRALISIMPSAPRLRERRHRGLARRRERRRVVLVMAEGERNFLAS
jgi:hypothetical protein